jgi:hypothetical protein
MYKLGQLLVARGWVTQGQLDRALEVQRTLGGGLDTAVLELGVVSEERMQRALAQRFAVPAVDIDALRGIPDEVRRLLPGRIAQRHRAVPFGLTGSALQVAFARPDNLAGQDEVSFAAGRRIEVHVATEVRLAEALERYYGQPASERLTRLLDQLNRSRYLWHDQERTREAVESAAVGASWIDGPTLLDAPDLPVLVPPPPPEAPPPRNAAIEPVPAAGAPPPSTELAPAPAPSAAAPRPGPPPASIRLTPEESRRLYREARTPPLAASVDELTDALAEAERRLGAARDRETIGRTLLHLAQRAFERAALLKVRGDQVEGWLADREASPERFAALAIPLSQPSAFLALKAGSPFHLGPLPALPAHRTLVDCWDGRLPAVSLLLPLRVGGRLVAVLYGGRRQGTWATLPTERLRTLASLGEAALERCILLKKQRPSARRPD